MDDAPPISRGEADKALDAVAQKALVAAKRRAIVANTNKVLDMVISFAPVVVALRKDSHPVAWVAAGLSLIRQTWRLFPPKSDKSSYQPWPCASQIAKRAIIDFLVTEGCGASAGVVGGVECRVYRGCVFGHTNGTLVQPEVDPSPLQEWIWERHNEISLHTLNYSDISLSGDRVGVVPHSAYADQVVADCRKLRAAGKRVGLICDGVPGTGKSIAIRYVTQSLGNRVLRANLGDIRPQTIVNVARILQPTSVVLDDLDRNPTEHALTAIEDLLDMPGCGGEPIMVLGTTNDITKVCEAMRRPMRLDLVYRFGAVDEGVLTELLHDWGDRSDGLRNLLSRYPVAHAARYLELRRILGATAANNFLAQHKPVPENVAPTVEASKPT